MPLSSTVAMLPDTPDSRLLAELSSYSDDLSEASDTIDQALEAGHDSPLWQPLTSYAVVAYMRAFAHSNVRSGLLAHVPIPDDLLETHHMVRGYRNTTIAQSQSELSMSLPLFAGWNHDPSRFGAGRSARSGAPGDEYDTSNSGPSCDGEGPTGPASWASVSGSL